MHELVGLEEFLATNFGDSGQKIPNIVDDDAAWNALIPNTSPDAFGDGEMPEDASMQYRDFPSHTVSQTQSQTQILSLWKSEFETPHQDRTLPLLPTSPHSMNLFDEWEEGRGMEGIAPILERTDVLKGRDNYDYDYLDDDELACLPSQLRLSQGQMLPSQPASSPTARRMGTVLNPSNNATASLVVVCTEGGGGFTTAAGRQLAPPSEQSWAKARAILDMVAVSEQGPDLSETSQTRNAGTSSVPIVVLGGGFSTAGGKRTASPSKEAKARARALLTVIDRDMEPAQGSTEDSKYDVGEQEQGRRREHTTMVTTSGATDMPTCFPAFATASGRKIASPSKEAKLRARHLLALDDQQVDVQTEGALPTSPEPQPQVPFAQMSLFSTASGRQVKTPKKESIALATKILSEVSAERPLTRHPVSSAPLTPSTPKIRFALKRNGPKPLTRRALITSTPARPVMLPKTYTPDEPKQPMRTFLCPRDEENAKLTPLQLDFNVADVLNQSRSLWPLASHQWLQNHAVAILWKMLSYQRAIQESPCYEVSFLHPPYLIAQLDHRYGREFIHAHRSILKRICERDDSPGGYMILFIQSVERSSGEGDKFNITLSDGWYSLPAIIDEKINRLASERRLRVGSKVKICMAQVISTDACDILEASTHGVKVKIHGNSMAPARWDARLGKQKSKLFTVSLGSLTPDGGNVCCVEVVILRRYPINYMVEYESGRRRSLSRADLDQLEGAAFHMDAPRNGEGVLSGERTDAQDTDRIVSVKAPARFLIQDNCPCPRVAQAFLTIWEASEEISQRMQAGTVVKIVGLRALSQRRRDLLQLASTRNGTRVIFTKTPPRNPEALTMGPLRIIRSTDLGMGIEGDLYDAHVLTSGPDHCWLLISSFEDDRDCGGLAFVRAADGIKTPFSSTPSRRLASFLDVSFLYRDPRYGFPVFLFGELSQVVMVSDPAHHHRLNPHHGPATKESGEPDGGEEQSERIRNALQRVRDITKQS